MDDLHKKLVDQALTNGSDKEYKVEMTIGELFLFHTLLQDYGLEFVGEDRFIPLMERNANRLHKIRDDE